MTDNGYFSLNDTARSWLVNYELYITFWALFEEEARRAFVADHRKKRAEDDLRTRNQYPNKTVTGLFEGITRLLRQAASNLTEAR